MLSFSVALHPKQLTVDPDGSGSRMELLGSREFGVVAAYGHQGTEPAAFRLGAERPRHYTMGVL